MANAEQHGLLGDESPVPTTPASPAQHFSARHRPGYARVPSVSFTEDPMGRDITENMGPRAEDFAPGPESATRRLGLGIQGAPAANVSSSKVRKVTSPLAQIDSSYSKLVAGERTPVMSPPSTGGLTGSTRYDTSFGSDDYDTSYPGGKGKDPRTSLQSQSAASLHGAYAKSDAGLLSTRSRYDFEPHHCPSSKDIKHGRFHSWISIGILVLAVFSTAFSAIYLILALRGPRYGRSIRESGGALTPASAAFLTSFFAKMIELSFVTVVVAFVGQSLARRAFKDKVARGVTLAEMSMRSWVMQPGTMFTNWESVRYAGISFLGIVSLLAAMMALLYTTAATALVQPQLKWPDWQPQYMQGLVKTMFGNVAYVMSNCITPNTILYASSDSSAGQTCLSMSNAANAYHNYFTYAEDWAKIVNNGNGSVALSQRPKGYALYTDNTTIVAPWIEQQNITLWTDSNGTTKFINNITMAMPHIGVIQAAIDPANRIVQPDEVDGAMYNVIASVPSPILNVLCMTLAKADLEPFVYELWDREQYPKIHNLSAWPYNYNYSGFPDTKKPAKDYYLNGTAFDSVFKWGPQYGEMRYPPVFPILPQDYNTLLNDTQGIPWGRTAIYVLGKGGETGPFGAATPDTYVLCQLQAAMTSSCSTHYTASASGAQMEAVCEDDSDDMQYQKHVGNAWSGNLTISQNWPDVAGEWARSISLKDGIFDGDSSNTRQLTQLIVTTENVSTGLPSMAEALAVLGGCTIIDSIKDSSFAGQAWNYTINALTPGQIEYFNATVQALQYASGGSLAYQKAFYVILFGLFIMSFLILVYFAWHKDWYSDFSEPSTLFALTLNSPPSEKLAGSCGCGPSGTQFKVPWKLANDGGHYYVDSREVIDDSITVSSPRLSRKRWTEFDMTPMTNLRQRFASGGSPRPSRQTEILQDEPDTPERGM